MVGRFMRDVVRGRLRYPDMVQVGHFHLPYLL